MENRASQAMAMARVTARAPAWRIHRSRPQNGRVVASRYVMKLSLLSAIGGVATLRCYACVRASYGRNASAQHAQLGIVFAFFV